MKINPKIKYLALFFIIILAIVIRFYHLGSLPANMQEDEVMTGYVGRYILQNGVDVYGNKWPLLYFNKFGDFYIIGPIYLKGLATYLFGTNAFAVRFPTALFGALTVLPVYLLSSLLFQSTLVGLCSAFAVAVMPWTIPLGRASSEGILGGFFFLMGVYHLLAGYRKEKITPIILGGLYILFTFWIYHNYRLLSSLFVLGFIVLMIFERKVKKNILAGLAGIFILCVALTIIISKTPWGRGRFDQTGILSPMSGVATRTQELIYGEPNGSVLTARLFHNKILGLGREFLRQYSIYFSGEYLFIKGGKSEAYAVPEQGLMYLSFLIPLLFFVFQFSEKKWMKQYKGSLLLLLYFILISPIPSALTIIDAPNIQRSILLGLLLSIPVGVGYAYLWEKSSKRLYFFGGAAAILFLEMVFFWHNYTVHTDAFTSMYRNDGQKELISYLRKYDSKTVYLPTYGTMSMYYLFYNNDFSASYAGTFKNDVKVDRLKNIRFVDTDCPSQKMVGQVGEGEIIVDPISSCGNTGWEKHYSLVTVITGANKLLGFRVLTPLPAVAE
jgi:4-amino-4-deoxy-L-arabinose transferase-like glycosyltransferase